LDPNREEQSIEDFLEDVSNRLDKKADIKRANAVNPYISLKALQTLLEAASSSPTCRKIAISASLAKLQVVRDFLSKHSYRIKKDGEHQKTYRRYSMF
jgi:hypothetical protein